MKVGVFSQVRSDRRGETASSCAMGVSNSILGKISSPGRLSSSGRGCPGIESPPLGYLQESRCGPYRHGIMVNLAVL